MFKNVENMVSYLKDLLKYSVQYACVTHCFFEYIGDIVMCSGPSMEPTLFSKNVLLTERITTRLHKPCRGDIIIAISPTDPQQYICKRVIGLPGDKIILKSLPLNIQEVKNMQDKNTEPNTSSQIIEDYVPKGFVWIEGDNHENSSDSRYYGPIPLGLIRSRAICRIWPLNEMKLL